MESVARRFAVVTGAAGGLGSTIATALAAHDVSLLLVDIDDARLLTVSDSLASPALVADVSDAGDRRRILAHCHTLGLAPDVLINNAGIEKASGYADLEADEIRHALEVNLLGAMLLTHIFLPELLQRGQGHVINVASMAAIKTIPFNAVYNTAKAGMVGFSMSLSKELSGTGVDATVICPSAVARVGMWARASDQLSRNRLVESSVVRPEAVAAAVLKALAQRPRRVLVGSPLVRLGALLSAVSPSIDRATDRLSRIDSVYRERIGTDRGRPL